MITVKLHWYEYLGCWYFHKKSMNRIVQLYMYQDWTTTIFSWQRYITPLLKGLRWLPVKRQLYFRLAVLVFKCMTECAPAFLTSKFVSTRTPRNSEMLSIPIFRTASGQRSFEYRATSLWNQLQPALQLSKSVTSFKRQLRRLLLAVSSS